GGGGHGLRPGPEGVRPVAGGRPSRHGPRARRRLSVPPVRDRLVDRARGAPARAAQRLRVRRGARAHRGRGRRSPKGGGHMSPIERGLPGVHRTTTAVPEPPDKPGPLEGLRVVELASEYAAFGGRLLADFGAEVILVEPSGGAPERRYAPFVDDVPDPERSLYWWHYQSNKYGVVIDLDDEDGRDRWRDLVATADIVLEAEPPGRL